MKKNQSDQDRSDVGCDETYCGRKIASQTSDNMSRWQGRGGKSPRRERKKIEGQRREKVRRKNASPRKGREVAKHCVFFHCCVNPERRRVEESAH